MEKFFNYITKPIKSEDVEVWLKANNIILEKVNLFNDFCVTLNLIVEETYLGDEELNKETNIRLTEQDNKNHFKWCWNKTISNFKKEGIIFNDEGEHYNYFLNFFQEIFYLNDDIDFRKSTYHFYDELFDLDKPFTKSDLDMLTDIYKLLNSNIDR